MKITIPISVGELLDKITILEIKSLFSNNFYIQKELEELNEIKNTITQCLQSEINELKEVNQILWKIEDQLREKEKLNEFDKEFIQLARQVYITNDKRAAIKKQINLLTDSEFHEVKLHK